MYELGRMSGSFFLTWDEKSLTWLIFLMIVITRTYYMRVCLEIWFPPHFRVDHHFPYKHDHESWWFFTFSDTPIQNHPEIDRIWNCSFPFSHIFPLFPIFDFHFFPLSEDFCDISWHFHILTPGGLDIPAIFIGWPGDTVQFKVKLSRSSSQFDLPQICWVSAHNSWLTGAFCVGNGWVAGGWWDDYYSDYGSFPKIPY
jgi:hypothetical protein